ncbi:MAG: serine/threonine protein kinase [Gemmatimonadetes bacterium]|nr:serine/threonine protein kinase [Gemmatimonadota bacterium]
MPNDADSEFIALQEALAGRYSLQRELGRGGMGIVYLAHEVALDRPVALKLLPPLLAAEPALRERFMREARTAARLSQPNIVPIHTVEQVGNFVFFTMAYVEGESLGAAIRRRGPLPAAEAARIIREVAWALAYAHAQGVVHRDVKADNILLEEGSGRALVTDFGIAQVSAGPGLTGRGELLGTAEFMSPEQASGEPVDERSDIYSLGVVGFYILTGRLPFEAESVTAILAKHITQAAPRVASVAPEVPKQLAQAVDRCLAKKPADRFANGEDLAAALSRSLALRREIPLALRVFIKQNREQVRGLVIWGIFTAWCLVASVIFVINGKPMVASLLMALTGVAMGSVPPAMLLRMARNLLRSGYGQRELLLAFKDDLHAQREELAFELGEKRTWVDRLASGLLYGGLGATGLGTGLAFLFDLSALPGVVADGVALLTFGGAILSTLVGLPLAALRGSRRPELSDKGWMRFWESRVGKWLFNAAGFGLKGLPAPTTGYRPTEMAIGMAVERLFGELPKGVREELNELPAVVGRLEQDAQAMRQRVEELNGLLGDLAADGRAGAAAPALNEQRDHVAEDLERARAAAQARLQDAVTSLETIRLDLLRMHAGSGAVEGITENLSRAGEIAIDIERLLEGQAEVERALEGISGDQSKG